MSREVMAAAIRGAHRFVEEAETGLHDAIERYGGEQPVAFPETAFSLPMICALMGLEVQTLGELRPVVAHCRELLGVAPLPGRRLGRRSSHAPEPGDHLCVALPERSTFGGWIPGFHF